MIIDMDESGKDANNANNAKTYIERANEMITKLYVRYEELETGLKTGSRKRLRNNQGKYI